MATFYKMDPVLWDHATASLTLEEEAAYLRICNAIYRSERGCPNLDRVLAGMFRSSTRKARALVAALIDKGKLFIEDGQLWNEKAKRELQKINQAGPEPGRTAVEMTANAARNADETYANRGRNGLEPASKAERNGANLPAKSLKVAVPVETEPPPKTRLEETRLEKEKTNTSSLEQEFERFWVEYPRRLTESGTYVRGSKQQAYSAFRALSQAKRKEAIDGLPAFKRVYPDQSRGVCDAVRYFTHERWRDVEGLTEKPSAGLVIPRNSIESKVRRLVDLVTLPKYRAWFEANGACLIEPRGDGAVIRAANQFAAERIEKDFFSALNTAFGFGQWKVEMPRQPQTEAT